VLVQGCVAYAPTRGAGMQARPSMSSAPGGVAPASGVATKCRDTTRPSCAIAGVASMAAAISPADINFSLVIRSLHQTSEADRVWLLNADERVGRLFKENGFSRCFNHPRGRRIVLSQLPARAGEAAAVSPGGVWNQSGARAIARRVAAARPSRSPALPRMMRGTAARRRPPRVVAPNWSARPRKKPSAGARPESWRRS
jgi:hypothetical protein